MGAPVMAAVLMLSRRLGADRRAMTAIEYAILAGSLVVVIAGVVSDMGGLLNGKLLDIINSIS